MADESVGTKVTNWIVAGVTIIASFYGGFLYIESKFEDFVEKKLEPYQQLLVAQSMDSDDAILEYEKTLKTMLDDQANSKMLKAVIAPYLTDIANSEKPFKYQHHTESIKKHIGAKVSLDYDMANSLGWIYLSTNELEKSRNYFIKSISLYKQADLLDWSSNTYDGLMLTYLIDGDMENALSNYNLAWEHDYTGYNPQVYYYTGFQDSTWAKRLFALYPNLKSNHQKLLNYLRVTYALDREIEPKEIDQEALKQLESEPST